MDDVRLKMNPAKTEFIYFGNPVQLKKCTVGSIKVDGDLILRTHSICYLGAWLNSGLNFKTHVTKKLAMANLQRIKSIRHLLDEATTANLCISLCILHLDYANSILYGLPDTTILKMQQVQNICAKLMLRKSRMDSPKACLYQLQWLPIKSWIILKILVLTCKCLSGQGPQYLRDLIVQLNPRQPGLRSESEECLLIPKTKCKTFAVRSFSVAAPSLWNTLPEDLKTTKDIIKFKKQLKHTYSLN